MEGIQDDRKAEKEITVTQLPNYGSERFFLLSELKLAGTVIECLDESIVQHEGEPPSKAMSPSRVAYTNLVYIVHEHKEGITAFQNQIDEVMDRVRLLSGKEESENETKTYVFGETHVTDNHNEPSKDQELKQGGTPRDQRLPGKAYCLSLLEYIDKKYPNIYERIIGVSNHTGACPSLDACVNLVNSLAKISSRQQRFRFIIGCERDMLGVHGKTREPDAVGAVVQYLLGNSPQVPYSSTSEKNETTATSFSCEIL